MVVLFNIFVETWYIFLWIDKRHLFKIEIFGRILNVITFTFNKNNKFLLKKKH